MKNYSIILTLLAACFAFTSCNDKITAEDFVGRYNVESVSITESVESITTTSVSGATCQDTSAPSTRSFREATDLNYDGGQMSATTVIRTVNDTGSNDETLSGKAEILAAIEVRADGTYDINGSFSYTEKTGLEETTRTGNFSTENENWFITEGTNSDKVDVIVFENFPNIFTDNSGLQSDFLAPTDRRFSVESVSAGDLILVEDQLVSNVENQATTRQDAPNCVFESIITDEYEYTSTWRFTKK